MSGGIPPTGSAGQPGGPPQGFGPGGPGGPGGPPQGFGAGQPGGPGGPGGPGWSGGGYPPPAPRGGAGVWVAVLAGLLVVGLAGGGLWWWLSRPAGDLLASGEVFLEPLAEPGLDAFTESVAVTTPLTALRPLPVTAAPGTAQPAGPGQPPEPPGPGTTPPDQAPGVDPGDAGPVTVVGVDATRPGLYGGTRDNASCDVEQLISFLQANPDKAAAFASVPEIAVVDLPGYLRSLTPLILRNDTRVINHGFANGRATPRHAVLQAGTAVLVDAYGIPRVRCACGNPLLPPQPVAGTPEYTGTSWPGFQPTQVITIVNQTNITVTEFVIIEVTTGDYLTRPPGSPTTGIVDAPILVDTVCDFYPELCRDDPTLAGGSPPPGWQDDPLPPREGEATLATGEVQITLRWEGSADLDLSVTSPLGDEVFYGNPMSASGGVLDVDANAACELISPAPAENIVWGSDAPVGQYVIEVVLWDLCGDPGPVSYTLTALIDGVPTPVTPLGGDAVAYARPLPVSTGPWLAKPGGNTSQGCAPAPIVQPANLLLAQASAGAVSPEAPRTRYTVDKPPSPLADPPPADPPPADPPPADPPPADPPPAAPPPAAPDPGEDGPLDCSEISCAEVDCGPLEACRGATGFGPGHASGCSPHPCHDWCCDQCSFLPDCDCRNPGMDFMCGLCCYDPESALPPHLRD